MDPRLLKIARIILIPLFLFFAVSAYHSVRDVSVTKMGQRAFERSLSERWPVALATLDKTLALWHVSPYKKGAPFSVLAEYSYQVGNVVCKSNRFEFGPRKTIHTDVKAGDKRLNDLIKGYCSGAPLKTTTGNVMRYDYTCQPIPVYYDPQNACVSYIAKTNDPAAVQATLKKNMLILVLMIVLKLILASACLYGALPVLKQGVHRLKQAAAK